MSNQFAIPGFQPPDAPKYHDREFAAYNEPFIVTFLKNVSVNEPARSFDFYLTLEANELVIELLAYSFTNRYVFTKPSEDVKNAIDYYVKIEPDVLSVLPSVIVLHVSENGKEIFRKIVNVQGRPSVPTLPPSIPLAPLC